jgi:hypothetical protein
MRLPRRLPDDVTPLIYVLMSSPCRITSGPRPPIVSHVAPEDSHWPPRPLPRLELPRVRSPTIADNALRRMVPLVSLLPTGNQRKFSDQAALRLATQTASIQMTPQNLAFRLQASPVSKSQPRILACRTAASISFSTGADTRTSGSLTSGLARPNKLNANFGPAGLGSRNSARCRGAS